MFLRIAAEVALAIATYMLSSFSWPLWKRDALLKRLVRDKDFLARFITQENLSNPPPSVSICAERHPHGYAVNILGLVQSDRRALRRLKIQFGVPLLLVFVASFFLGPAYLFVNLVLSGLLALIPLGESARASAMAQVFSIGVILHKWHAENPEECERFIQQAWSLRAVHDAVVRARDSGT